MTLTIEEGEEGPKIASKWAGSPADLSNLRREAEMLALAQHPGVVELLDVSFSTTDGVIRLRHVDGTDLARVEEITALELAGVAAAIASTLADLHLMGVVHGAVTADHILIDTIGRPLLCGFGSAQPIEQAEPSDDVAQLGETILTLASRAAGGQRETVRALATWASSPDRQGRPSAAELAAAYADRIPDSHLLRRSRYRPADGPLRREPVRRPSARSLIAVPALVAALLTGWMIFHRSPPKPAPAAATSDPTVPRPECDRSSSDPTDLACPFRFRFSNGILEAGDRRWKIGSPGDRVAVAEWGCRGERSPVLLDSRSGRVWAFDKWADTAEVVGRSIGVAPEGEELDSSDADGDGCLEATVTTTDQTVLTFDVEDES